MDQNGESVTAVPTSQSGGQDIGLARIQSCTSICVHWNETVNRFCNIPARSYRLAENQKGNPPSHHLLLPSQANKSACLQKADAVKDKSPMWSLAHAGPLEMQNRAG